MSNAKSVIMVPIVTLAVCAIAMVGLGFAITTVVTSDDNAVEKLMVDLGSTPITGDKPSSASVDKLLTLELYTEKEGITVSKLAKGSSFMKIFGNIADVMVKIDVNPTGTSVTVSEMGFKIYEITEVTSEESTTYSLKEIGSATVNDTYGHSAYYEKSDDNAKLTCNTDYILAITSITLKGNDNSTSKATISYSAISNSVVQGEWDCSDTSLFDKTVSLKYTISAETWKTKTS